MNAFGGSPSSDGKADGGAALGGGYKGHTGNISIIGGARVSATGAYGASAIGCGADGSSYKPAGGKISVENGCEIKAYSDGTKWAIDLRADTGAITHGVLQGRFLSGALKQGENPLEIRNAAENPVLPDAYRCFASNVPDAGIYYVEASDRQKYPVYTVSYLKNEGDAAFFIRFAVSSQSLYSFDFLDFRAGLAEDAGTAGGDSQDEPPPPPESEKPAPQTTSEGGIGESVSVETPEEEIPDTNEHNGFILFCFSAWLLFSILFLIKLREPNLQKENSKSLTRGA